MVNKEVSTVIYNPFSRSVAQCGHYEWKVALSITTTCPTCSVGSKLVSSFRLKYCSITRSLNGKRNYSNPCRSRNFFTPPQPSPNPRFGSKKFTNDLGLLYQVVATEPCNHFHQENWAERSGGLKPRHKLDGFSLTLRLLINSLSTSVLVLPTALQCCSIISNSNS